MSLHDSRILAALVRAKARLSLNANTDTRSRWTDIVCAGCGKDHRAVAQVDRVQRFNKNHDPSTGEFSSGRVSGRLKALAKFKAEKRAESKDLKKDQSKEWKSLLKVQRGDRQKLLGEQRRERSKAVKTANKKLAKLQTAKERNEHRAETRERLENLNQDHVDQRAELLRDQRTDRQSLKQDHKEAWDSFKFGIGIDATSEGFKKKSRMAPASVARKLVMAAGKTSKASSAEAILRHCLRATGLSTSYRAGSITISENLTLLEEIRQYGRAWLRHEAKEFARQFAGIPRSTPNTYEMVSRGVGSESKIERAVQWIEGPGGYLIQQDAGFRHAVGRFFGRAKSFVRELILSATMALSGPAPLTGEDLDAADREAQKQEQFLDRFHRDILIPPDKTVTTPVDLNTQIITVEPTPMTPGQFVARSEMYADSAWQAAQRIDHEQAVKNSAFKFERRVLGQPKTEHCEDCPPIADMGWQPIGTLPAIGDSACGSLCLCHFRYSDGESQPEFIRGKNGPLRAPSEVSMLEDSGDVEMIAEPPGGLRDDFPIAGPP